MPPSRNVRSSWPTVKEYDDAFLNARVSVHDSAVKYGKLARDRSGIYHYGGIKNKYVCVYRLDNWMIKCFTGNPPLDIGERYLAITAYQRQHAKQLPFLVSHFWVDPGIRVGGEDLPFVKSEYVEHIPLGTFLGDTDESRYKDRGLVHNLAHQWLTIVTTLESLEMAHGDFDITNILVCGTPPNVTLRLIDFDSMYVPDLARRALWEQGHENFQPTTPGVRQFNREMDRFSALVIYLSLIAIEEDPILWETCKANEEDKLLLGANDFRQFGTTDAYFRLRAKHNNQNIQKCLDELAFSIRDSRMPRSLPEILGSTSGYITPIVPYSPPPLPMPVTPLPEGEMSEPLSSISQDFPMPVDSFSSTLPPEPDVSPSYGQGYGPYSPPYSQGPTQYAHPVGSAGYGSSSGYGQQQQQRPSIWSSNAVRWLVALVGVMLLLAILVYPWLWLAVVILVIALFVVIRNLRQ